MARPRRKKVPKEPIECSIVNLSHEGRGVAKLRGKTQFVEGALAGERVSAKYLEQRGRFDELATIEVFEASPDRVSPPCKHVDLCGGCSLQHMSNSAQISFKQGVLKEQFQHFGGLEPEHWVDPLTGPDLGYRSKARLGVRYIEKRNQLLVGFREKRSRFLTDIERCEVLDPRIGHHLPELRALIGSLSIVRHVAHIEVAACEETVALIIRHLAPLADGDESKLHEFAQRHKLAIYLQPGDASSVHKVWPNDAHERLFYQLPVTNPANQGRDLRLAFHPLDFTQVNEDINRQMIERALSWLDVQPDERVLDLFCGLGNFTIPLATKAAAVVGVEGDAKMVERGTENASLNALDNVCFYATNLQADFSGEAWAKEGFDKVLIDPPRSGALDVVNNLASFKAKRVVYVSCNPATLARDAGVLIDKGYRLVKAGVMDMFPHTTHVESIALFEM